MFDYTLSSGEQFIWREPGNLLAFLWLLCYMKGAATHPDSHLCHHNKRVQGQGLHVHCGQDHFTALTSEFGSMEFTAVPKRRIVIRVIVLVNRTSWTWTPYILISWIYSRKHSIYKHNLRIMVLLLPILVALKHLFSLFFSPDASETLSQDRHVQKSPAAPVFHVVISRTPESTVGPIYL